MRLWMIWPVLAVIWALQAAAALYVHHGRPAVVMFALSFLFFTVGSIVRRRTRKPLA